MEFFVRAPGAPARLGIFPGAYNPPTRAHFALARAALGRVDEVVFVVPQVFPHKEFEDATFEQRVDMLCRAAAGEPRFSVAAASRGLFIDIAMECREAYGESTRFAILCGRDAAERIVNWNYGRAGAIDEMLEVFELLVAARAGEYVPPDRLAGRIHALAVNEDIGWISATDVRARIREGQPWEHLVPEQIRGQVRSIYAREK
jgi:nicotinate-nucleotide adenylyltransferase